MTTSTAAIDAQQSNYFNLLADMGHTKHIGGMPHGILNHGEWQAILENSDLEQIIAEPYALTARAEAQNQYKRISIGDYLRTFGAFFKAIIKPQYRKIFRSALGSAPKDYFHYIGYGVYGGRKRG